jgi:hypothetical protein
MCRAILFSLTLTSLLPYGSFVHGQAQRSTVVLGWFLCHLLKFGWFEGRFGIKVPGTIGLTLSA